MATNTDSKFQLLKDKVFKNPLLKKTLKLSSLSIFANFIGFLIPIYIAYSFGVSEKTDNFFLSYGIITFCSVIFAEAVRTVVVPFLKEKKDILSLSKYVSSIFYYLSAFLGAITVVLSIVFVVLYLFTGNIIYFYIVISLPIFFLSILNAFCYGILNTLGKFYLAETSPISRAIIIIATIALFKYNLGITSIILGYCLGELAKLIHLLYIVIKKNNVQISFKEKSYDEIKEFLRVGFYQSTSTALASSSTLIDKVVAYFLIVGSISILDYGDKLFIAFSLVLNSFLVIMLQKWAEEVQSNTFNNKKFRMILATVFVIGLVGVGIMFLLKGMFVNLLYPTIDKSQQAIIAMIFLCNTAAFAFNCPNQVLVKAIIVFRKTKMLIKTSLLKSIINLILDVIFAHYYGVIGIAISTIFVNLFGLVLNYVFFNSFIKDQVSYKDMAPT